MRIKTIVSGFALCCGAAFAQAPALPDPSATDPSALGWMQGFPPPPDKLIKFSDGSNYKFPRTRWSFSHTRELVPTANVWRGDGRKSALPQRTVALDGLKFIDDQGKEATWAEMLTRTYTDGVLVMHKGEVIYEKYFGAGAPELPHAAFSVDRKSVV